MKKPIFLLIFLTFLTATFLLSSAALAQPIPIASIPKDDEIRKILVERLGALSDRVGIVVGVIDPDGRRVIAHGAFAHDDQRRVDGDTVFEIGSASKVFTSLLLASMVQDKQDKKVSLDDPVSKHLPSGVVMPERGRAITLEDLARHRSGLPRLPDNLEQNLDPQNPYAHYTVQQLYDFLSNYRLTRTVDSQFEYSNLGAGLLGHVLALAGGKDYETLIRSRICAPLGMKSTAITLSPNMKARLAPGHDNRYERASNWDIPTLAGAGAIRSTANDMLSFLAAQLGYAKSDLDPAIALTRAARKPADGEMEIGLGWMIRKTHDSEVIWHNGGTGGYRSFAGFDLKARTGVVVLTNVSTLAGVDDLGFHLLDRRSPLLPADSPLIQPPKGHKEIALDVETLDLYVGRYQLVPNIFVTVSRKGGQLFAEITGQPALEIYPESKGVFFYKAVDAQITFRTDQSGRGTGLTIHQLGASQSAKRVEGPDDNLQEWFGHRETRIDPALLDNYVGRYQMPNGPVFAVTREGDKLYTQLTGQQRFEVFPEGEHDFFAKGFDAQITFEGDPNKPASAVIIHQNGRDLRGERIKE